MSLEILSAKGRQRQWSLDSDIDWHTPVMPPDWLPRSSHAALVSQFMYGERATIDVCRRLLPAMDDAGVRALLDTQIADEERHAKVFERYLGILGEWAPMEPAFAETLDRALAWTGSPLGLVVFFHIVLEGEALRSLQALAAALPCPLFRQINTLVARDEARHVAFGKHYLRRHLADMPLDERIGIFRWIRALWRDGAHEMLAGLPMSGASIDPWHRHWVDEGWAGHSRTLAMIGLVGQEDAARLQDKPS